jgi:hypothetical protein
MARFRRGSCPCGFEIRAANTALGKEQAMSRKQRKFADRVKATADTLLCINPVELVLLDEAGKRAEADIKSMIEALDSNAESHKAFMAEIARLRAVDNSLC